MVLSQVDRSLYLSVIVVGLLPGSHLDIMFLELGIEPPNVVLSKVFCHRVKVKLINYNYV